MSDYLLLNGGGHLLLNGGGALLLNTSSGVTVEGPPPYPTVAVLGESAGVSFRRQPATPVAVLDEPRNEVKL